jgi:UDP-N-acetylglucosamine 1-carboxyvinyltransferase
LGKYIINGDNKLSGVAKINGSKNSILPILAATILNSGESIVHDCPNIKDVDITIKILKHIGCRVSIKKINKTQTVIINSSQINSCVIPISLVTEMRSSIIFMGSLLARMKNVTISYPGGCKLGHRPIDFHIKALEKLGAKFTEENKVISCSGKNMKATKVKLNFPSVGATQNIILASVFINGTTEIINAAREPEIIDLENFLKKMGANINGAGTKRITIRGVKKLHNVEHKVIPDRIVAGTYLAAAAITRGNILLENVIASHLPINCFQQIGCVIKTYKDKIYLRGPDYIKSINIKTAPYPGFPTDLQAPFSSILCVAADKSIIKEKIFESRNKHIAELLKMGAKITTKNNRIFTIHGVKKLHGADVISKDLRGGAALILAALAAEGKSTVYDNNYISRGYEKIHRDLKQLGADIKYKKTTENK